jgi:hypothetical protein
MTERLTELLANLFAFDVTADLLGRDFVQQALLAAALLALVSGLIGPFIVMRQMSFAVHGSSELSLTGASFALLAGFDVRDAVASVADDRVNPPLNAPANGTRPSASCSRSASAWRCCSSTCTRAAPAPASRC